MAAYTLYCGDNLQVLRENIDDESVDLIYLDPLFNSKASYSLVFRTPNGENVSVPMIRDLGHVIDREKASIGLFITLTSLRAQ